jgi:hypothetical protein
VRINPPAAVRTFNIASFKTTLGSTLSHKSKAISFPGNFHRSPDLLSWRV